MSQYPPFIPMTEPLMKLGCEWPNCTIGGFWYVAFGCLEGHVDEGVLCMQHYTDWGNSLVNMKCGCGRDIELADEVTVRKIHHSWAETLRRDQSARLVRKHFKQAGVPQASPSPVLSPVWNVKGYGRQKTIRDYYKDGRNRPA